MSPIHELTELLAHLPGLGPRQARRVVQFLLSKDQSFRKKLAAMIESIRDGAVECTRCHRFDDQNASGLCSTCADGSRDASQLMVVEHDVDIDAVEASLTYHGYYFVLGGLMNLTKQRKDKVIRTAELKKRVGPEVKEVIFALAATPEGDFTAKEITTQLSGVKTSMLGRGLSIGAELEYADPETLRSALKNRS
jgi:recombination protein RecR